MTLAKEVACLARAETPVLALVFQFRCSADNVAAATPVRPSAADFRAPAWTNFGRASGRFAFCSAKGSDMLDDSLAGRGARAPERSRLLVAIDDGVFLWPGTALLYRIGNGFFVAEPRVVNSAIGCLFGPAALDLPLQTILERARDELRNGRVGVVQEVLDKLLLPPVWLNGERLIRAIADRHGLNLPDLATATHQDGTAWDEREIATFARLYDCISVRAQELSKVFNPGALNPHSLWDPDKHPRHSAGETDGGQFASSGGGDASIVPIAGPPPPWHNHPPERIGEPPKIPAKEPDTTAAKFAIIRSVAYWLGNALKFGSKFAGPAKALVAAAQAAAWLRPYISAYLQGPKTLEQLQADAKSPSEGYEIHHIVEQTPAGKDGFSEAQIESQRNKVRIPTIKHWELNAWYDRPNEDYRDKDGNWMTPRQYVRDKSWLERRRVGLDGLRRVGVLK